MKIEELSVEELEEKEKELAEYKKNCEKRFADDFIGKIRLIVEELGDFEGHTIYREPKNFWEKRKERKAFYLSDRRFLKVRALRSNMKWYLSQRNVAMLDIGFIAHPVKEKQISAKDDPQIIGVETHYCVIYKGVTVLSMKKSSKRPKHANNEIITKRVYIFKGDDVWMGEIDKLYLLAFEKKRIRLAKHVSGIFDDIVAMEPEFKLE
jgi:hypothetical protein